MKTQKELYRELTELLTLEQYKKLMGGDMSYISKAQRAKEVSKSKKVNELADQIINFQKTSSNPIGPTPKIIIGFVLGFIGYFAYKKYMKSMPLELPASLSTSGSSLPTEFIA